MRPSPAPNHVGQVRNSRAHLLPRGLSGSEEHQEMNVIKQWTESPILSFLQFSQIPCVSATRVYPMNTPPPAALCLLLRVLDSGSGLHLGHVTRPTHTIVLAAWAPTLSHLTQPEAEHSGSSFQAGSARLPSNTGARAWPTNAYSLSHPMGVSRGPAVCYSLSHPMGVSRGPAVC